MTWVIITFIVSILYLTWQQIHNPKAQIFGKVIWKSGNKKNWLALTFDDGPNSAATERILKILKKHNVKATFFIIGQNALNNLGLLKKIAEEGHEIEIHSFSHSPLLFLATPQKIRQELLKTKQVIIKQTGQTPRFFRPPWGNRTPWLLTQSQKLDLTPVTWSVDPWDAWLRPTPKRIVEKVKKQIHNGAIILLHDGIGTKKDPRKATIAALPKIIDIARKKKFSFVLLRELLSPN